MKNKKFGYQYSTNSYFKHHYFHDIVIDGHYILALNLLSKERYIFDRFEQESKLYSGEPCVYIDKDFKITSNYYGEAIIHLPSVIKRKNSKKFSRNTLKKCIRLTNKIRGLKKDMNIYFRSDMIIFRDRISTKYVFKVNKETSNDYNFKISKSEFLDREIKNINPFYKELILELKKEGFIYDYNASIAYGYNKVILIDHQNDEIKYDNFKYFNKWSQAEKVPSEIKNIKDIITLLQKIVYLDTKIV